jgi:uncharacterized protein involved in exopolysaccharide biosynthesis
MTAGASTPLATPLDSMLRTQDMQTADRSSDTEDELDAVAFLGLLWRHRMVVVIACILCALIAAVLAFTATVYYRAEAVVTEVKERGMSGAGALQSQLGGIASLAGLNLTGQASVSQQDAAILESRHLVEEFITRNDLLPVLAGKARKPPTLWLAVKQFKEGVVTIRKDARKGVTTVAADWTDANTAARWANGFVALANDLIRRRAVDESSRNIAYVNEQLARTTDVELRRVMYNIIESETKTLMLANGRAEYAFEVIDPAVPPEVKDRPHRLLMILVGVAFGLAIGCGIALAREQLARARRRRLRAGAIQPEA